MVKGYHKRSLQNLETARKVRQDRAHLGLYVPAADTFMQQITCKENEHVFQKSDDESPHSIEGKYEGGQPVRGLSYYCVKCQWPAYKLVSRGEEEMIVYKMNKKYGSWLD